MPSTFDNAGYAAPLPYGIGSTVDVTTELKNIGYTGGQSGPGVPSSSNFSFGQAFSNLWGELKPIAIAGAQTLGQIELAKAQAKAQAELNKLHAMNASLGPNDPNAAQNAANKTLAQRWLPNDGKGNIAWGPIIIVLSVLLGFLVVVRLIFRK